MEPDIVYEDVERFRLFLDQDYDDSFKEGYSGGQYISCLGECEPTCEWCEPTVARREFKNSEDCGHKFPPMQGLSNQVKKVYIAGIWMYYVRRGSTYRFEFDLDGDYDYVFYYDSLMDQLWWYKSSRHYHFDELDWELRAEIYLDLTFLVGLTDPAKNTATMDERAGTFRQ